MINTQSKKITLGVVAIIIIFLGWYSLKSANPLGPTNNEEQKIAILKSIFKNSVIIPQPEKGEYKIEGDDKIEYSIVDNSPIREKSVDIELLNIDLDKENKDRIIALTSLIFFGDTCTACRARFYIDVLRKENGKYTIQNEQEFKALESGLFLSDIEIKRVNALDINNDGIKEIEIVYSADNFIGLDKIKNTILQWQNDQFEVIWQQITHINMANYGRLQEEDKQNYDATFSLKASDKDYPDIVVNKTISKENGIELTEPRIEVITYKFNGQVYELWKEEKISQ